MYEKSTLPNGLRVVTAAMPHARSVSVGIFVGAGSRYEEDRLAGASHFLEHMLFKGTESRPRPEMISGAIEGVGGIMNASTSREETIYWTKVGAEHLPLALDVLVDMVRRPILADDEHARERDVILEELSMTYDQPAAFADMLLDQTIWPGQAMGRDIGGSRESVNGISQPDLAEYHASQYVPSNTVVAVAGGVTHDQVVTHVEKLLGDWADGTPRDWYRAEESPRGVRIAIGQRKTDQAHIAIALDGVSAEDPSRFATDLMSSILGEGMTSRLFMKLREQQGLAYDVHSSSSHYRDCGAFTVYCGTEPPKVERTLGGIRQELELMAKGVSEEELSRATEYMVGRMMLRLEDTRAVMAWGGAQELLLDRIWTPEEVVDLVRAVTAEDVKSAAERYLGPGDYRLAVVGPYRSEARFRKLLAA